MIKFFKRLFKIQEKENAKSEDQDEDKEEKQYIPSQFEMLKFYSRFINVDYKLILLQNVQMLIGTMMYARQPFVLLEIKEGILSKETGRLKYAIGEFIASALIKQLFIFLEVIFNNDSQKKTYISIQMQILKHLFSLDIQYFEDNKISQISQVVSLGADSITEQLNYNNIFTVIDTYIYYGGQIYFLYCASPVILATMLLVTLVSKSIQEVIRLKEEKYLQEVNQGKELKDYQIDDLLNNIQLIKTFGTEKKEIQLLDKISEENVKFQKNSNYYSKMRSMMEFSTEQSLQLIIIVQLFLGIGLTGSRVTIANQVPEIIGHIYCTVKLADVLFEFIISKTDGYFEERKKYIGKVMELFKVKPKIPQDLDETNSDQSLFEGNITFDNVTFKYPISKDLIAQMRQKRQKDDETMKKEQEKQDSSPSNITNISPMIPIEISDTVNISHSIDDSKSDSSFFSDEEEEDIITELPEQPILLLKKSKSKRNERQNVLENISFSIKKGQFVAFVGMSGSGKSTIVKLIQRYYDVNSGSILYDGQNIKDVSLNKVRRSIGLVSQEPTLFDNDIEYNITYGCVNDEYTQEELRNICDMSGVSEFVFDEKRFPQGLKTLVGSKGMKLSGGQKQRIAIARALIKKPKILILDEATSALDSESEHIVQQYIDQLVGFRGMTIIVVAHRLSTVMKSDNIFVMKNGSIQEQGTHTQLLAKEGIYKKLVHHQINFQSKLFKN